jgi:hypothetical protein
MKTTLFGIALLLLLLAPGLDAVQDSTCGDPFEQAFPGGGDLRLHIRSGDIDIVGSDASAVRVLCEVGEHHDQGKAVRIRFDQDSERGTLRIDGGPKNDVRFRIEVPKHSHLYVRCPAGDLTIAGVVGNKDVRLRAGDLTISVGDPDEYATVDAWVTAGDLRASAFGITKGGLFRSFHKNQAGGRHRLQATLWAGDLTLK